MWTPRGAPEEYLAILRSSSESSSGDGLDLDLEAGSLTEHSQQELVEAPTDEGAASLEGPWPKQKARGNDVRRFNVALLGAAVFAVGMAACLLLAWGSGLTAWAPDPAPEKGLMTARDVADTLSAYAQMGRPLADSKFNALTARAEQVVADMDARDVARTLDAYARMARWPRRELLSKLGMRARQVVGDMDAQDVADTINAYAELGPRLAAGAPLMLGGRHEGDRTLAEAA